jgi:hypothetical protein
MECPSLFFVQSSRDIPVTWYLLAKLGEYNVTRTYTSSFFIALDIMCEEEVVHVVGMTPAVRKDS